MDDFLRLGTRNVGGGVALRVIRVQDVLFFPEILGDRLVGNLGLRPGERVYDVVPVRNSLLFDERCDVSGGSPFYSSALDVVVARDDVSRSVNAMKYARQRFIVLYVDRNGTEWCMGLPDAGARMPWGRNHGSRATSRSELNLVFEWSCRHPVRAFDGVVETSFEYELSGGDLLFFSNGETFELK